MIPTFFTTLALGSITTVVAAITALSTFISGSAILQGNLFYDTTNNATPKEYVNTTKIREVAETGETNYAYSLARGKRVEATCTASGGTTNWSPCWIPAPLSTTGSLLEAGLECGNVTLAQTGDFSLKLGKLAASGTVLTNLDNVATGTGVIQRSFFTTEVPWSPLRGLSFSTLVSPAAVSIDCKAYAIYDDKYGS